jgi:hypothetical protein
MMRDPGGIVVVTRETRLEGLLARFATKGAAKFLIRQAHLAEMVRAKPAAAGTLRAEAVEAAPQFAGASFTDYEAEDTAYQQTLDAVRRELDGLDLPVNFLDRRYLPNFNFANYLVVVVVGQDGLVANAAKYVGDRPIVAVNPDPQRIDGILLPFQVNQVRRAVRRALDGKARIREITLAEVQFNDGQKLLAFNDFFIGCSSHISARYTLRYKDQSELQSSSGVLVSTGVGSTGWLSSVFNMAQGIARFAGGEVPARMQYDWEDPRLVWVVREPFRSKTTSAEMVAGVLDDGDELVVESLMPKAGVIFSDGVEADFLEFQSGTIARFYKSPQKAHLVVS